MCGVRLKIKIRRKARHPNSDSLEEEIISIRRMYESEDGPEDETDYIEVDDSVFKDII